MANQPEISIGLIGHVDHGKTTILEKLSGKWADTHSEEKKRGITIRLGYADVSIYECPIHKLTSKQECKDCKLKRTVSFIDAPGHETLMATMLSGTAIMDGALLLIAANEQCPQPQTKEHLKALEISNIKNIIIIQNKIDMVTKEQALENYKQIKDFTKKTIAENAPIIPISAIHQTNIDLLIETIEKYMPTPKRDSKMDPIFFVARSFDVNKPGDDISHLVGGVLGGSLKQGILKINQEIVISPGRKIIEKNITKWIPIKTKIIEIWASNKPIDEAHAGGSIALQTSLDPSLVKADQLVGNTVSLPTKLLPIWDELKLKPSLLEKVIGSKENKEVHKIKKGEALMLNVNAATTAGMVTNIDKKNNFSVKLKRPICAEKGANVAISRMVESRWRLIGTAEIN
ncbi:MAG TPA: translation initiation factor IF-2 subunit gamma [Candidatus Nanoarchaeia archaeon]|nr:translation initiation factor IF-2 subunit gamma [Candidatus Nanoarchaeia archaeon]